MKLPVLQNLLPVPTPVIAKVSRLASHSPYCVGTGSGWKVKCAACLRCVFERELQLGVSFSRVAPKELCTPVPTPVIESLEFTPRMKNRAAAAITVVVPEQERQDELKYEDRLVK